LSWADFTLACAGFSERYGRLIGWLFEAPNFDPVAIRSFASPDNAELQSLHPAQFDDVVGIAIDQIITLRRDLPDATGGTLVGAEITAPGVATRMRPAFFGSSIGRLKTDAGASRRSIETVELVNA